HQQWTLLISAIRAVTPDSEQPGRALCLRVAEPVDGADPTRACAGTPEPGPADVSRTAQGQACHRCLSAAVSEAQTAARMAGQNDRGAQHGKRGGPCDPDYRPFASRRSPDLIQVEALPRVVGATAQASEGSAHDFSQRQRRVYRPRSCAFSPGA